MVEEVNVYGFKWNAWWMSTVDLSLFFLSFAVAVFLLIYYLLPINAKVIAFFTALPTKLDYNLAISGLLDISSLWLKIGGISVEPLHATLPELVRPNFFIATQLRKLFL